MTLNRLKEGRQHFLRENPGYAYEFVVFLRGAEQLANNTSIEKVCCSTHERQEAVVLSLLQRLLSLCLQQTDMEMESYREGRIYL